MQGIGPEADSGDIEHISVYFWGMNSIVCSSALCTLVSVLLVGCTSKDSLTVWKDSIPSPDGSYVATVDTIQNGGFGSASIETSVYLAQSGRPDQATKIVGLSCDGPIPRPYVLDNVANNGGSVHMTVNWVTPAHLLVTYQGHAEIDFQAVKFGNIEITLQNLADKPEKSIANVRASVVHQML
jgi:hypothetical protein